LRPITTGGSTLLFEALLLYRLRRLATLMVRSPEILLLLLLLLLLLQGVVMVL
jgi:hypothetical protein